jgi:hypothetical protein
MDKSMVPSAADHLLNLDLLEHVTSQSTVVHPHHPRSPQLVSSAIEEITKQPEEYPQRFHREKVLTTAI